MKREIDMSSDYGYINARIRGLRSRLLKPERYIELLNSNDFNAFISQLTQTPYISDIEEAQSRFSGIKIVDNAVSRNFYNTSRSILGFADGKPRKLISNLLLKYDLDNIKVIARAKHAKRSPEDTIAKLLPAGELKPVLLEAVAAAPDMQAAASALSLSKSPLKLAFKRAANQYSSDSNLLALEVALDKAYYRILAKSVKSTAVPRNYVKFVKREIDANNLRTALSLHYGVKPEGIDIGSLFVKGGKEINKEIFNNIVNIESQNAFQVLANGSFAEVVEATTLTEAEIAIRNILEKNARALASDSVNIGLAVNYLRQKETESAKLRLLARGKFYGVDKKSLETELGYA